MHLKLVRLSLTLVSLLPLVAGAQITVFGHNRTAKQISDEMDGRARLLGRNLASLTSSSRAVRVRANPKLKDTAFFVPMRVKVMKPSTRVFRPFIQQGLTLAFDSSGSRAFSAGYQAVLQNAFTTAQPTLNAIFGQPSWNGTVFVRNYDADLGDRNALAGGYYVQDNGSGQAEIRLPVYNSNEAASLNLIHCVLLAYLGPKAYTYDAFTEGLVRAALMKVARTPGALPSSLAQDAIETSLQANYDVGANYDAYNQRALGGPTFIAPNLRDLALPSSGSLGGIYLLRYLMAGSAWYKLLVEYPGFATNFNQAYYSKGLAANDVAGLVALGQTTINNLSGSTSATVEGLSFSEWFRRQYILETKQTYGPKLLVEPVPITSNLSGSDFGPFAVQANYFSTDSTGNETLLSGACYPLFWDENFNRLSASAQSQKIDISGAYGSVVPNFADDLAGAFYRVTTDLQVGDAITRTTLPVGAIATAKRTTPNDFYGTVEGAGAQASNLQLTLNYAGQSTTLNVQNGAFGTLVGTSAYLDSGIVTVTLTSGSQTLLTRQVNKSKGGLWLDLRVNSEGTYTYAGGLPSGVNLMGLPLDPYSSDAVALMKAGPNLLLGRYDASSATYSLYPNVEALTRGHGYFVRLDASQPAFSLDGRASTNFPASIALKPGWNMVSCPLAETVPFSRVQVIHALDNPTVFASAQGDTIGADVFGFQQGAPDPASNVPEVGTLNGATTFEPGKGYFIKCLAPEGVILTFFPATPGTSPYVKPNVAVHGYQLTAVLSDSYTSTKAILGSVKEAATMSPALLRSELPPSLGGLQIASVRSGRLYRDLRSYSRAAQVFSLHLEGLSPGKTYKLSVGLDFGTIDDMRLTDNGVTRSVPDAFDYSFVAANSSKDIALRVAGRSN